MTGKIIRVAAAVIRRGDSVLICGRPENSPLFGYREFPGGKLEPGESAAECIVREIREELGMKVMAFDTIWIMRHQYPDKFVEVEFIRCAAAEDSPEPMSLEHQETVWVKTAELTRQNLLPADAPFAAFLEQEYIQQKDNEK